MSRPIKLGAGAAILLAVIVLGGAYFWYWLNTPPLRRALPWNARDVVEHHEDMFPDYSYYLKATISEDDFKEYAARLGLTPHTADRAYGDSNIWLSWRGPVVHPEKAAWWTPSVELHNTHVLQSGHSWTLAKWEDGTMYLKSFSH